MGAKLDPDKKAKHMSPPEYARYREISETAVYQALRAGKINRIEKGKHKGKIDRDEADELWIKNTKRIHTKEESPEAKNLTESRARKEAAIAEREELRTQKMKGNLINRAAVLSTVQTIARQNRDMWLNWPKLVAVEYAEEFGVDSGLVYDVLHNGVKEYLHKVATLDMDDAARSN